MIFGGFILGWLEYIAVAVFIPFKNIACQRPESEGHHELEMVIPNSSKGLSFSSNVEKLSKDPIYLKLFY